MKWQILAVIYLFITAGQGLFVKVVSNNLGYKTTITMSWCTAFIIFCFFVFPQAKIIPFTKYHGIGI